MEEFTTETDIKDLLYDHKHYIENTIGKADSSFDLLMRFFAAAKYKFNGSTDLEAREPAKEIYRKLGWDNEEHFDVINSFWMTFKRGAKILGKDLAKKEEFSKDYVNGSSAGNTVKDILKVFPKFEEFAGLTHCAANFMSCPKFPYNTAKGFLKDVEDCFPLMMDKIQKCANAGNTVPEDMTFMYYEKPFRVYQSVIDSWHGERFIKNREKDFLEDYYVIKDGRLKGIPLFNGQTLENPLPQTEEQMNECLDNIIKRIKKRAKKMAESMEKK